MIYLLRQTLCYIFFPRALNIGLLIFVINRLKELISLFLISFFLYFNFYLSCSCSYHIYTCDRCFMIYYVAVLQKGERIKKFISNEINLLQNLKKSKCSFAFLLRKTIHLRFNENNFLGISLYQIQISCFLYFYIFHQNKFLKKYKKYFTFYQESSSCSPDIYILKLFSFPLFTLLAIGYIGHNINLGIPVSVWSNSIKNIYLNFFLSRMYI